MAATPVSINVPDEWKLFQLALKPRREGTK